MHGELILASASPRRSALLDQLGVRHRVAVAAIVESRIRGESPQAYVQRIAMDKATTVLAREGGAVTVLAADTAVLGWPEVQRGFVPAMVMTPLRRLVGERVAFDLVTTGRLVGALEAQGLGLVSRVVAAEAVEAEGQRILQALAGASPTALALTKKLLYALDGASFEEGVRQGARVNALARATPDFRRAVEAFLA